MLFNSFQFLIFFPVVTLVYFLLPHKYRWFHLLAASCVFYMAFVPVYILILFATIIIDYFAGIMIEQADLVNENGCLTITVVLNILVLAIFKYYNFFLDEASMDIVCLGFRSIQFAISGYPASDWFVISYFPGTELYLRG